MSWVKISPRVLETALEFQQAWAEIYGITTEAIEWTRFEPDLLRWIAMKVHEWGGTEERLWRRVCRQSEKISRW